MELQKELIIISAMWCPSCLLLNKTKKKIEKDFPTIKIKTLDYDLDEKEVKNYLPGDILPIMIMTKNKKELKRLIGEHTYTEIKEFLASEEE